MSGYEHWIAITKQLLLLTKNDDQYFYACISILSIAATIFGIASSYSQVAF